MSEILTGVFSSPNAISHAVAFIKMSTALKFHMNFDRAIASDIAIGSHAELYRAGEKKYMRDTIRIPPGDARFVSPNKPFYAFIMD